MRLEYAFRMKKNNVRSRLMKDMKIITKDLIEKLPDMEKYDCDFTDPEYIDRLKKWKEVIGVDDNYVDMNYT